MKKYVAIALVALAAGGLCAQVTQTSSAIDPMLNDRDLKASAIELSNELVADVGNLAAMVVVDTNANVSLTSKKPAAIGQVLVTPNSTNVFTEAGIGATNSYLLRVSIAYGLTTNDWAKIATDK